MVMNVFCLMILYVFNFLCLCSFLFDADNVFLIRFMFNLLVCVFAYFMMVIMFVFVKHSFFVSQRKVSLCALVDLLSSTVAMPLNSLSTVVYCPNTSKYIHIHTDTDHTHSCKFTPATCC